MTLLLNNYGRDGGRQERAGDGELAAAPLVFEFHMELYGIPYGRFLEFPYGRISKEFAYGIWNMEIPYDFTKNFLNFRMEEFQKNFRMECPYGIFCVE